VRHVPLPQPGNQAALLGACHHAHTVNTEQSCSLLMASAPVPTWQFGRRSRRSWHYRAGPPPARPPSGRGALPSPSMVAMMLLGVGWATAVSAAASWLKTLCCAVAAAPTNWARARVASASLSNSVTPIRVPAWVGATELNACMQRSHQQGDATAWPVWAFESQLLLHGGQVILKSQAN
jgi:hypothetical protein